MQTKNITEIFIVLYQKNYAKLMNNMIHLKPNNSNMFYIDETSKSLFEINNNFYNIHPDILDMFFLILEFMQIK
jgi:hypothetical protein